MLVCSKVYTISTLVNKLKLGVCWALFLNMSFHSLAKVAWPAKFLFITFFGDMHANLLSTLNVGENNCSIQMSMELKCWSPPSLSRKDLVKPKLRILVCYGWVGAMACWK